MIDCIVLGDSIAVGTHQHRSECIVYAESGINSKQWNNKFINSNLTAHAVIISLGSNDHQHVKTYDELKKIRERTKASKVFWILPHGNLKASNVDIESIRILIREIAIQYGDTVLPITSISKDNIHPTGKGYRELADRTKTKNE